MGMLNETNDMRLTRFGYKIKDLEVNTELQLTYESKNEVSQTFLAGFAKTFEPGVQDCFIAPAWDNIKFNKEVAGVSILFAGEDFTARIKSITVTRRQTKDDVIFKYNILLQKEHDKDEDYKLAQYLNSKIENADGKKEIEWFETEITGGTAA
jgi:hypothetical protein